VAPEPPQTAFLAGEEGLALAYADWVPEDWDGTGSVVLFVHGSSAHGALYATLGQGLSSRGVYARLIDMRGHGLSRCPKAGDCDPFQTPTYTDDGDYWPGRPGDALDEHQLARDLNAHLDDLRARAPDARLVLAGHSSGAGLVSRTLETTGTNGLAGAALLAPFNHPEQPQVTLGSWECGSIVGTEYAQVDLGALGDARRGNPHRYVLTLNKQPDYQDPLDTLQYTYSLNQGLAVTDAETFHQAFVLPTLWVAGQEDQMLDLEASRGEFERLPYGSAFVEVAETSHVGVSWSDGVAAVLAAFAVDPDSVQSGVIEP
jgi:alpha-beta hydrolase superfamily lysophospholipase